MAPGHPNLYISKDTASRCTLADMGELSCVRLHVIALWTTTWVQGYPERMPAWGFVTTSEVHVCLHCLVVLRRTVCIMRADEGASRWIGCSLKSLSLRHLRSSTSRSLVDVTVIRKKADLAKQLGATSVHGPSMKAQGEPPRLPSLLNKAPRQGGTSAANAQWAYSQIFIYAAMRLMT